MNNVTRLFNLQTPTWGGIATLSSRSFLNERVIQSITSEDSMDGVLASENPVLSET